MQSAASNYEPYLSFYGQHAISPVRQDISDLQKHFQRRGYLYRHLGLPPFALAGKAVAEFGPGSGYNALYTTALGPSRYLLVDGNPTGMEQTKALLQQHFPNYGGYEFVLSRIQDYKSDDRFDAVFCEGVIPHQKDPGAFSRHVGSFVKPGGVLGITTADYVSVFPEALRRVICDALVESGEPLKDKVAKLVPVFKSHYETLPGASRPVEDWLIDSLLDTWGNPLYSFEDAVRALDAEFEVYGGSPKFMTDWRWYKDLNASSANLNERAVAEYRATALSLMDCRNVFPAHQQAKAAPIRQLCEDAYWEMIRIRNAGDRNFTKIIAICDEVVGASKQSLPEISAPVAEVAAYLRDYANRDAKTSFDAFRSFYGRGQQYVSFVRRMA
jgi:2-polyprenyl-3-methyl-5-hydroxy-6-metoxy-1,4-benzoquinol methylase